LMDSVLIIHKSNYKTRTGWSTRESCAQHYTPDEAKAIIEKRYHRRKGVEIVPVRKVPALINYTGKLSVYKVKICKELLEFGWTYERCAMHFKCCRSTIWRAVQGDTR